MMLGRLSNAALALGALIAALAGPVMAQPAASGGGADLMVLDKLTGALTPLSLARDAAAQVGFLRVELGDCRYPPDNPAGEAYALLRIFDQSGVDAVFAGWMLASAPALNALDHPRYDVWVIRCTTA